MTLSYADTSVWISAYTEEISSALADAWMASIGPADLASSLWCETEIASALAAKTRAGLLTVDDCRVLRTMIRDVLYESATLISISSRHFQSAADFLFRSKRPLRGGDALHLAIAADAGAALFTLDRGMAEAGIALGLDVSLIV